MTTEEVELEVSAVLTRVWKKIADVAGAQAVPRKSVLQAMQSDASILESLGLGSLRGPSREHSLQLLAILHDMQLDENHCITFAVGWACHGQVNANNERGRPNEFLSFCCTCAR